MKFCIWNRHERSVLAKADQIKIRYSDRGRLVDYIKDYLDKTFILYISKEEKEIDWALYASLSEEANLIFCIENLALAPVCASRGIAWYWAYPVFTYYDLNRLTKLHPCYISLGAPLSFDLEKVSKRAKTALRLCPTGAYDAYIPSEGAVYGSWIRPEDLSLYESFVDAIDFMTDDLSKEATLLHVYKENGTWPGNLNLLIPNFGINVSNIGLPDEFGATRLRCGQRCQAGGACRLCQSALELSNAARAAYYHHLKKEKTN